MAGSNAYAGTDQPTRNGRAPGQAYDGRDNHKQTQSSNHHLTLPFSLLRPSNYVSSDGATENLSDAQQTLTNSHNRC